MQVLPAQRAPRGPAPAPAGKTFRKNRPLRLTGEGDAGKLLPRRWTGREPRTEGGAAPAGPRGTLKTGRCAAHESAGQGTTIRMAIIHSFIN